VAAETGWSGAVGGCGQMADLRLDVAANVAACSTRSRAGHVLSSVCGRVWNFTRVRAPYGWLERY
jgi:hypothetical protein